MNSTLATTPSSSRGTLIVLFAWAVFSTGAILLGLQNISTPGLYYDEAVFAGFARDFITGQHRLHTPGFEIVNVFGRPFPVFIQFYLGALKSWILIPAFSLFGPTIATIRLTSLGCGLLALLLFMLAVRRWIGLGASLVAGVILLFDPAFFFLGVLDWGAAIPAFFCRCVAFYLIVVWSQNGKARYLLSASVFLGLGIFNKVDFATLMLGVALSALCFFGLDLWKVVRSRPVVTITAGLIGFLAGAGPMLLKLPGIIRYTAAGRGNTGPAEFKEKLNTCFAMYDGSYFHRLMSTGGLFDQMYQQPAGTESFLWIFLAIAIVASFAGMVRNWQTNEMRLLGFLVVSGALTTIAIFLMPGAVRIHHSILVFPFPQLIIGFAFSYFWSRQSTGLIRSATRAASIGAVLILLASQIYAITKTETLLRETGGRGRWSNALNLFCREMRDRSDVVIVSLDWGFNEQLAFLTDKPNLVEPFWAFSQKKELPPLPRQPQYIYLAHPAEYSLFRDDLVYLNALQNSSDKVDIHPYFDEEAKTAFYVIRFLEQ